MICQGGLIWSEIKQLKLQENHKKNRTKKEIYGNMHNSTGKTRFECQRIVDNLIAKQIPPFMQKFLLMLAECKQNVVPRTQHQHIVTSYYIIADIINPFKWPQSLVCVFLILLQKNYLVNYKTRLAVEGRKCISMLIQLINCCIICPFCSVYPNGSIKTD